MGMSSIIRSLLLVAQKVNLGRLNAKNELINQAVHPLPCSHYPLSSLTVAAIRRTRPKLHSIISSNRRSE
jgi:hypothetical protein